MSLTQLSDRTQVVEDQIKSLGERTASSEDSDAAQNGRLTKIEENLAAEPELTTVTFHTCIHSIRSH